MPPRSNNGWMASWLAGWVGWLSGFCLVGCLDSLIFASSTEWRSSILSISDFSSQNGDTNSYTIEVLWGTGVQCEEFLAWQPKLPPRLHLLRRGTSSEQDCPDCLTHPEIMAHPSHGYWWETKLQNHEYTGVFDVWER